MARITACDLRVSFIPLPAEKRAAWDLSLQIMCDLLIARLQAQAELKVEAELTQEYHVTAAGG